MKRLKAVGILAMSALLLSACGGTGKAETADEENLDLSYAVITHGAPGDAFWDRVKSGAERAGEDYDVDIEYSSDPDPAKQSGLIDGAVADKVDGIVVSMANPDGLESSIKAAVAEGVPVVTINSGIEKYKEFGAITHVGQSEEIAGEAVGEKLKELGLSFGSPREALAVGIATVHQDLAVVPLMPVWRNFFLGSEVTNGWGPLKRLDVDQMKSTTKTELAAMGIDLRDVDQPIGTLSGGERQCVAIARAVYFGARVLILDEPTAALGVKQSGVVLKYIAKARERGLGVVFITHNPHHAYPVGDRFMLLRRGKSMGDFPKAEMALDELTAMMAGGAELEALSHELTRELGAESSVAQSLENEVKELHT